MTPTPTPPAEVDVAEGRRLLEAYASIPPYSIDADNVRIKAVDLAHWCERNLPALLTAAEQVAGLRETILSAANICEHWADESRNGGWSTHQVEPNRRLAASLRKAALGAAP